MIESMYFLPLSAFAEDVIYAAFMGPHGIILSPATSSFLSIIGRRD